MNLKLHLKTTLCKGAGQQINHPKTFDNLYASAKAILNPWQLSESAESGGVAAALLTKSGNIYLGVCIDTACSMGFCAEHSAAASMITAKENHVVKMIAVDWDGRIMPPCGRCREFISQLHDENLNAEVMVAKEVVVALNDLLPHDWRAAGRVSNVAEEYVYKT